MAALMFRLPSELGMRRTPRFFDLRLDMRNEFSVVGVGSDAITSAEGVESKIPCRRRPLSALAGARGGVAVRQTLRFDCVAVAPVSTDEMCYRNVDRHFR